MTVIAERKTIFIVSIFILTGTILLVTMFTIMVMYETAIRVQKERLRETARVVAGIIKNIAGHSALHSSNLPGGATTDTMDLIRNFNDHVKILSKTGELILAKRQDDGLIWIYPVRHHDSLPSGSIPISSPLAEPMQRAVAGESGVMIGRDYRNVTVLAAYEFVTGLDLGLVVKIDLNEVRLPFVYVGLLAVGVTLFLAVIGASLFGLLADPIIRRLAESEERFRRTFDEAPIGAAMVGLDLKTVRVNAALSRILGYSEEELLGRELTEYSHPQDLAADLIQARELADGKIERYQMDKRYLGADGQVIWARLFVGLIRDQHGRPQYFLPLIEDITELKHAEISLKESEDKFRGVVENASEGIAVLQGDFAKFANPSALEIFGFTLEEALSRPFLTFLSPENHGMVGEKIDQAMMTSGPVAATLMIYHRDGQEKYIEANAVSILWGGEPGILTFFRDVSQRIKAEERLAKTLQEREILLQEIHHRVRNNMQIISSLLRLQSAQITPGREAEAFLDCQERVRAMALVHDLLYHSGNFFQVDMSPYINQLGTNLFRAYHQPDQRIEFKSQAMGLTVTLDQAVPIGLILCELISNSLKYAFPGGRAGLVEVSAQSIDDDLVEMIVADDGVGLPRDLDPYHVKTLGLQLVLGLVEGQLKGTLDVRSGTGTIIALTFLKNQGTGG